MTREDMEFTVRGPLWLILYYLVKVLKPVLYLAGLALQLWLVVFVAADALGYGAPEVPPGWFGKSVALLIILFALFPWTFVFYDERGWFPNGRKWVRATPNWFYRLIGKRRTKLKLSRKSSF